MKNPNADATEKKKVAKVAKMAKTTRGLKTNP